MKKYSFIRSHDYEVFEKWIQNDLYKQNSDPLGNWISCADIIKRHDINVFIEKNGIISVKKINSKIINELSSIEGGISLFEKTLEKLMDNLDLCESKSEYNFNNLIYLSNDEIIEKVFAEIQNFINRPNENCKNDIRYNVNYSQFVYHENLDEKCLEKNIFDKNVNIIEQLMKQIELPIKSEFFNNVYFEARLCICGLYLIKDSNQKYQELGYKMLYLCYKMAKIKVRAFEMHDEIVAHYFGVKDEQHYLNIRNIFKGFKGEMDTLQFLTRYFPFAKIYRNIRLPIYNENYYNENDVVLICHKGIFTFEVKNTNWNKVVCDSSGDFYADGNKQNMVEQCNRHLYDLYNLLISNNILDMKIASKACHGICLLTNGNTSVNNMSSTSIMKLNMELINSIQGKSDILTNEDIDVISAFIDSVKIESNKYPYYDINLDKVMNNLGYFHDVILNLYKSMMDYVPVFNQFDENIKEIHRSNIEKEKQEKRLRKKKAIKKVKMKAYVIVILYLCLLFKFSPIIVENHEWLIIVFTCAPIILMEIGLPKPDISAVRSFFICCISLLFSFFSIVSMSEIIRDYIQLYYKDTIINVGQLIFHLCFVFIPYVNAVLDSISE